MNADWLRTEHYGYERRPEYGQDAFGQPVLLPDPQDEDWWRPLLTVRSYRPLSQRIIR